MKALTFDPHTDAFRLSDLAVPSARDTDVLIKVDACGLNPVDAKIASWKSMAPNMLNTWVPGLDVSGRIVEVGSNVGKWNPGDRVLCHGDMFRPHGGFAEYTVQDSDILTKHPDVSAELAAATPCAGWTAWRALVDKLHIHEHDSVLVAGGSGGVGGFAVQLAAYFGLETIIATCSRANQQYVKGLGATHVIDYENEDVVSRVLEITHQKGVSVGLDTVGPGNDRIVANALKFEGQMVELVDLVRPAEYNDAFMKGLSFHQLSLGAGHRNGAEAKAQMVASGAALSDLLERGELGVPVLQTLSMDELSSVLSEMLNQRTVGKLVVKV